MVKCADCGYLAVRHLETRELREAEGNYRDTGEIPRDLNRPKHLYEEVPLCFEHLRIFDPQQCASAAGRQEALQAEIGPCVGFTEWHHGFTPKEHREMLDRRQMLEWQAGQEKARLEWERAERAADRQVQKSIAKIAAVGVAIAIIAIVVGTFATARYAGTTVNVPTPIAVQTAPPVATATPTTIVTPISG